MTWFVSLQELEEKVVTMATSVFDGSCKVTYPHLISMYELVRP